MNAILQDLRFALRMLAKSPGFTIIAVITLTLGIGANTAIFSVVNAVLLRALPFQNTSQIIDIFESSTSFDFPNLGLSLPDIADLRAGAPALQSIAVYQESSMELSGQGQPQRLATGAISESFFPILGLQPVLGRTFTSADMQSGTRSVIVGNALWRTKLGGDPKVVGKTITLDGQPRIIVGVMPQQPKLGFLTDAEAWTPFVPSPNDLAARKDHTYSVIAQLKSGVRIAQAQQQLDQISAQLASDFPDADKGWSMHATSLKHSLLGDTTDPLIVLFCAVGFVLLIACANVSNLFLSRGWARRREFAIRSAIGATRGALLRQIAAECFLVALAGGTCAFLVSVWTVRALQTLLPPDTPRLQDIRVEGQVALFTLGATLLAALISGLAPALLSSRQNVVTVMKQNAADFGVAGSRTGHHFLRRLLVVAEVALAVILVIGASLALRSLSRLMQLDSGFRTDHLVTIKLDFPKFRFATAQQAIAFIQQTLDDSRSVHDVSAVSAGFVFPASDMVAETTFQTEASVNDSKLEEQSVRMNRVAPEFFRTLGIPLLAGRDFSSLDGLAKPQVAVVNEALAHQYFGSLDVLGNRVSTDKESGQYIWAEIIGVVGNARDESYSSAPKPLLYLPLYQMSEPSGIFLVARSSADPLKIVPAIEEHIWSLDKNQPISGVQTMDARIAEVNATPRSQSFLLGIFASLGLLLALLGVYGVMSYLVTLQTREFGIRMALGADPRQILRTVIIHGLKLTLTGVALGLACALVLTRFMSSLLFGVSASDPFTFAAVAVWLTLVAIAACYVPARRATQVDPLVALRYE